MESSMKLISIALSTLLISAAPISASAEETFNPRDPNLEVRDGQWVEHVNTEQGNKPAKVDVVKVTKDPECVGCHRWGGGIFAPTSATQYTTAPDSKAGER